MPSGSSAPRRAFAPGPAFIWLRRDVMASLVIFFLGVPLAMGAAVVSGVPPQNGLLGAAVGGFTGAGVSGAPFLATGPAVPLALLTRNILERHGFVALAFTTVAAGILQLVLGGFKLARFAAMLDDAILEGMLGAVGISLCVSQALAIIGQPAPGELFAAAGLLLQTMPRAAGADLLVAAATLAAVVLYNRRPWVAWIPGVLVAIAGATALSLPFSMRRLELPAQLPWEAFAASGAHALSMADAPLLLARAVELAMVSTLYALLTALAVDALHPGPRAQCIDG